MKSHPWLVSLTLTFAAAGLSGCGSTCADDGFVWQQNGCPGLDSEGVSASETESATESASASDPTESASASESASATDNSGSESQGNSATESDSDTDTTVGVSDSDSDTDTDGETVSATNSESDTEGGGQWCADADGDGFGDPAQCMPASPGEDPPPGTADNDGDCDDQNVSTFPGAAELDDPRACMQDVDDDGYGDPTPDGPDAVPGTDCDDNDVTTFPGAAEAENPEACMKDEDGDGWGDSSVPEGVDVGADCIDTNADLNPADRVLYSILDALQDDGDIGAIDLETGEISVYGSVDIPFGQWNVYSSAVSPSDGVIYGHNSEKTRLVTLDYCVDGDEVTELDNHGRSVCGIAFDAEGNLYGVDSDDDELVTFDPATGEITGAVPLTLDGEGISIVSCGMAYDCVTGRLLITDGQQSRILSVNPEDGTTTVVADPMGGQWNSVGTEYDPVTKEVYVANGQDFMRIAIDGSNNVTMLSELSKTINDINFGPTCE